jgi:hypothetical protein
VTAIASRGSLVAAGDRAGKVRILQDGREVASLPRQPLDVRAGLGQLALEASDAPLRLGRRLAALLALRHRPQPRALLAEQGLSVGHGGLLRGKPL